MNQMKKLVFIATLLFSLGCSNNNVINSCFNNTIQPIFLDVNNPQLNGVLTPNGTAEINGGLNGIVLFNKGTGSSFGQFIALDRQSPNRDCNLPMRIEVPFLVCPCEESKYSMLDGRLVSGENDCDGGARVYSVFLNGSSIQITN